MKHRNLSPANIEKVLDRCDANRSDWKDNQNRRTRAAKYRNVLKDYLNKSLQEQAKVLIKYGATADELANLTELKVSDIQDILNGKTYPYFKNAWRRIMYEPDAFCDYKLSQDEMMSPDEKFNMLLNKRGKR